ncbi:MULTISPECIES: FkbM family methyltransferase [Protofrankia]|uniref:Methyltransferase FkbM family n=1 Tax=Candidatus Protofrankia datiscae TaxID=2716812 RepID=F8B3G2_9ACTN|nr:MULTISPECIES: FkbM family methyltransferase [Protofrankia]AEH09131.1 methyltransferase FkbM family [Candidatus Protofrankia datiscae]
MDWKTAAVRLGGDLRQIAAVAGPATAGRYTAATVARLPAVVRQRNLNAVDGAMTNRPWKFRPMPGVEVMLPGRMFGGAREMYCRGVSFARPGYAPAPGDTVVDLGANHGLFSLIAAAAGAQVLAVEAQRGFGAIIQEHASLNGCAERIRVVHTLVDADTGVLASAEGRRAASHWAGDVPTTGMVELLDSAGFQRASLLKIDIEGSEFALFQEAGWLDRVDRVVMEVHTEFGDPLTLLASLSAAGFDTVLLDNTLRPATSLGRDPSGYIYARQASQRLPRRRPLTEASAPATPPASMAGVPPRTAADERTIQ